MEPIDKQAMEMIAVSREMECERDFAPGGNARELIAKGWRATYAELFGQSFADSLDSAETGDRHHSEAIGWHWFARIALLEGNRPPGDFYAYFPIWSRANNKSSIAERMVVIDAFLSSAYNQPGFCLYIGREKDRVKENIQNIEWLLSLPKVREYAPQLSEVARNDETNQKRQWTGTFLHTKANFIIKGGTVESTQAGSRIGETRVTFFVPDDIDSRDDSVVMAENRFKLLTTEILPMKQENTLTFFAQNLISRYSVMYRIQKGLSKVLTNRKPTEPIPAVRNLETEQRTVGGIIKDVVVAGQPTWRVWSLQRVQDEIDTYGLPAFLKECQHEVEQSEQGIIVHTYDDDVHVVSESQFASRYGSSDAWKEWHKAPFNDWARTKTAFHANVAGFATVSSQNTRLPGLAFYIPLSFAANAVPEDVATRLLSLLTPFAYGTTTWQQLVQQGLGRENPDRHFASWQEQLEYARAFIKNTVKQYSREILLSYNVRRGVMSHSEDTVRSVYNDGFGFSFLPSNPTMTESIEDIVKAFSVDYGKTHLFDDSKMGYTRSYIIAPDDKSKPFVIINGSVVYPPAAYKDALQPDELMDSDLMRYQLRNWRWAENKLTELGERVDVPLKLNDDFGQSLQMIFKENLLKQIKLTVDETVSARLEELLPAAKMEEIQATGDDAYIAHQHTNRARLEYEIREKIKKSTEPARPSWADIG